MKWLTPSQLSSKRKSLSKASHHCLLVEHRERLHPQRVQDARMLMQQGRGSDSFEERLLAFRVQRRDPKVSIRDRKGKCFLELCDSTGGYQWGPALLQNRTAPPDKYEVGEITVDELAAAPRTLCPKKAPGSGAVSNRTVKLTLLLQPISFSSEFNKCFHEDTFLSRCNVHKLLKLYKLGKPRDKPISCRPICLLDKIHSEKNQEFRTQTKCEHT